MRTNNGLAKVNVYQGSVGRAIYDDEKQVLSSVQEQQYRNFMRERDNFIPPKHETDMQRIYRTRFSKN